MSRIFSRYASGLTIGILFIVPCGTYHIASAQTLETVGTRALGMAGAFVAVSDDATAAYWNPAGLPTGAFFSLMVDRTTHETRLDPSNARGAGVDGTSTFLGLSTNSGALTYYRVRVSQVDQAPEGLVAEAASAEEAAADIQLRSVTLHNLAVTGARIVAAGVSMGTTLRYVRGSYGVGTPVGSSSGGTLFEDAEQLSTRSRNALDLDLGLKGGNETVQIGLVVRNLLHPTLEAPDGSLLRLDRQVRAGVAIRPARRLAVAADIDVTRQVVASRERRHLAVGAEYWVREWLGVRGGGRVDVQQRDAEPSGAFGFSLALTSGIYVDAHVTRGRHDSERGWGVAGRVGF